MDIGARIRAERERIGLTQSALGELAGVGRKTQFSYETGASAPDATYLAVFAKAGADLVYVVTGQNDQASPSVLSSSEERLVALFRLAPSAVQQAVLAALAVGEMAPPAPGVRNIAGGQVVIHAGGSVGHVVDASRAQGGVKLGDVYMGAPAKKKGK